MATNTPIAGIQPYGGMGITTGSIWSANDLAQAMDANGVEIVVFDTLRKYGSLVNDGSFRPCNNHWGHRVHYNLKGASARAILEHEGPFPSKPKHTNRDFLLATVAAASTVSVRAWAANHMSAGDRLFDSRYEIKAIKERVNRMCFYGNHAHDPAELNGFATYYNKIGQQVLDAGGRVDHLLTSIWIMDWTDGVYFVTPPGIGSGIEAESPTARTETVNGIVSYSDLVFKQTLGLVVEDETAVVRIANIDTSKVLDDPKDTTAGNINLVLLLIKGLQRLGTNTRIGSKARIYMPKDLINILEIQMQMYPQMELTRDQVEGRNVISFRGIVIDQMDEILTTESIVN